MMLTASMLCSRRSRRSTGRHRWSGRDGVENGVAPRRAGSRSVVVVIGRRSRLGLFQRLARKDRKHSEAIVPRPNNGAVRAIEVFLSKAWQVSKSQGREFGSLVRLRDRAGFCSWCRQGTLAPTCSTWRPYFEVPDVHDLGPFSWDQTVREKFKFRSSRIWGRPCHDPRCHRWRSQTKGQAIGWRPCRRAVAGGPQGRDIRFKARKDALLLRRTKWTLWN